MDAATPLEVVAFIARARRFQLIQAGSRARAHPDGLSHAGHRGTRAATAQTLQETKIMSTLTCAAAYTVQIAAMTAATPVLAGAAASAATAKLAGWELQQLASSPLSAEARRLTAEYRELAAANGAGATHASAAAGARRGRPRQAPPRSPARPLRSGPCPAGCVELVTLGTPAYRMLTQIIPLDTPAGDVGQPARGSLKLLPAPGVSPRPVASLRSGPGACADGARSGDMRAPPCTSTHPG